MKRSGQRSRLDEVKVVSGGVILGESSPYTSHQATNGKIEPRRTVLPLVITVRRELEYF
jgi:hypothetical protein